MTTLDLAAENAVAEFFPWLGEAVLLAAVPADIGDGGCRLGATTIATTETGKRSQVCPSPEVLDAEGEDS